MVPPHAPDLGTRREDGAALLASLRASGVELLAAFWWRVPSLDELRLVIVSPQVETRGPKELLRLTHRLLQQTGRDLSFTFFDVDYRSPCSSQVMQLVRFFEAVNFGSNSYIGSMTVDGIEVKEMYIFVFDKAAILKANEPLPQLAAE